jgi:exopolyphosphatase/guanosine-5'-triphosphate,3'-diphosphate pyrophosphatase
MRITRLGAGVDRSGILDQQAVERTIAVLRDFKRVLEEHGVTPAHVRAAATSATRDASNSGGFLKEAEAILGVRPEVIGGTEEGRLSYLGATASLDPGDGPYLVVDIGGGSTELVVGRPSGATDPTPAALASIDVGCVRVSERFLGSDPPEPRELADARAAVRELVEGVMEGNDGGESREAWRAGKRLIGLAGTVSALTVLALGLDHFDATRVHHARVSRQTIAELTDRLAAVSLADRLLIPGMERERADVIVGGALVLEEVMDAFGYDELTASESDILDGIAFGLLGLAGA